MDQKEYTKLFVTNIPGDIAKDYFVQLIQPYAKLGRIIEIKFFKRVVSESCYAFIHFESPKDGERCMDEFNRRILNGHTMRVGPASKRNPLLSTTNLYIEGVPREWTDQDLRKHFGEFGEISAARILVDKGTNTSREVGFVHFVNHEDALQAIETWQDKKAYPSADRVFKIKFANKGRKKDTDDDNERRNKHNTLLTSHTSHTSTSMSSSASYHHPAGPSQYPSTEMNTPRFDEPCRYFQRGNCKRGKNCFYRHGNVIVNSSNNNNNNNNAHSVISQHYALQTQQAPPPPPPPPPPPAPNAHDPYSIYRSSYQPDMSAYYQHYNTNPYYDYYQQAYAAYQYPQYTYPIQPQPQPQPQPQSIQSTQIQPQAQPQPPQPQLPQSQPQPQPQVTANNNNTTANNQQETPSTVTTTSVSDEKTNSTKTEIKENVVTNQQTDATQQHQQHQHQQHQQQTWYASSTVQPPNMTNIVPHANINPSYGASRHGTTAATDSRWDPYRAQNAQNAQNVQWHNYYGQTQ